MPVHPARHNIPNGVNTDNYLLSYDAENHLVEVKKNNVTIAQFVFDGDGKRVKSVVNGVTTLFVGGYYELSGGAVTKYYFAGSQRVAMRKYTIPQPMTVNYFLGDHLGSTSVVTDAVGAKISEMRYKAWGEIRYSWTGAPASTPVYKLPDYTYTGQRSYMDDPTTSTTEGFGLLFYNARWVDPVLGHFTQADSIVSPGVQGLDRYAAMANNPVRYTDPSGHKIACGMNGEDDCPDHVPPQHPSGGGSNGSGAGSGGHHHHGGDADTDIGGTGLIPLLGGKSKSNDNNSYCGNGYSGTNYYVMCTATVAQDLATVVDGVFAGAEIGAIVITAAIPPLSVLDGVVISELAYNVLGANAVESILSGGSTILTAYADYSEHGALGDDFSTSFTATVTGAAMPDPIGDFAIDGYASGYNHGLFNGVGSIIYGSSLFK